MQPHFLALIPLLLAVPLHAQGSTSLIGLTRGAVILNERGHHPTCPQLPTCTVSGLPAPLAAWAGGSAWDPMRQVVWVSNGPQIAAIVPGTCVQYCTPQPAPLTSPNAVVTGLEVVASRNELWMIDSLGVLYQCSIACQPTVLATCSTNLALGANVATGGLAVDECNGLVFYSYSNWTTGATQVCVAALSAPCQVLSQIASPTSCISTSAITGLAADGCRGLLYLTQGDITMIWPYTVAPGPVVTFASQAGCCLQPAPGGPGNTFVGLAVRPGAATSVGAACSNGSCPGCAMTHVLRNAPVLGNAQFGLDVNGAGFGTLIWCVVGLGPCTSTGPVIPPVCGPALLSPAKTLGPFIAPAGAGCSVYAPFNLPVPLTRQLCGTVFSSQFVALCPGTPLGTALSNCLSWELQSH